MEPLSNASVEVLGGAANNRFGNLPEASHYSENARPSLPCAPSGRVA
jgi:hypothetical protein